MERRQLELSGDFAEANTDASTIRTNPAVAARVSGLPSRPDAVTWYGSKPIWPATGRRCRRRCWATPHVRELVLREASVC